MKVDQNTIVFSSTPKWYFLEEGGLKPNTVRWLGSGEYHDLLDQPPNRIRITDSNHMRSFSRNIRWWGVLGDCLGRYLVMFCWET